MLHNNAPWLPPHQQQQQQAPQQHPTSQQQHAMPQQQQTHPVQQQQQLYASQMFQQQQPNYWPEDQHQQQPQQQQSLNYNNYFAGQQQQQHPLQQQQPLPPQQQQQHAIQQQLYYPTHQQPQVPASAEPALDSFDNNNSGGGGGGGRSDGWGDWGDWNDNSNNNNSNGSDALLEPPGQLLEDSFNVQSSQGGWQAFATSNNANNNGELPPPANPQAAPLQQQPLNHQSTPLLHQQPQSSPELGQEPELDAIVPPQAFQNQPPTVAPPPTSLTSFSTPMTAVGSPMYAVGAPSAHSAGVGTSPAPPTGVVAPPAHLAGVGALPAHLAGVGASPAPPPAHLTGIGASLAPPAGVGASSPPPAGVGAPPAPIIGVGAPPVGAPTADATTIAPPAALPPSWVPSSGNPFKRSTALSKRVNIMADPAAGAPSPPAAAAMAPVAAIAAIPPPAEQLFGLPAEPQGDSFNLMAAPPVEASLGAPLSAHIPAPIPVPTASLYAPPAVPQALPPLEPDNQEVLSAPNDERAQYLQTSHLSEQLGEGEADQDAGLLPPPGLSRLVLGQPELDSQQQRQVTGATEQPPLNVAQAAALHMQERRADGEDTSDGEQQVRNIQTPPRRVVTGVETNAPSLREQREVVLDGENLEDREAIPPPTLAEMPTTSVHHNILPDEPEQLHHNNPPQAMAPLNPQQPHQQQPLLQQQHQQHSTTQQEKKLTAVGRRTTGSLDLESDESDEFLQSERERDRERERRNLMEERQGRGRSHGHYTYEGETEDSVRGAVHHETKSLRETHHKRNHESTRSRRHQDAKVERERERDRERDRTGRRRSNKYHSGGEDPDRSYDHSRRYNNSNYDGESDNPEYNHVGDAELDGSGGRSSKTSRHRRSAAEEDFDEYERERNRSRRSTKPQSSAEKSRSSGGRRNYENTGRGARTDDGRRRYQEQRNPGAQYPVSASGYVPYGMYEQMSRNPQVYADMYAKFYGQMINSMNAAVSAAASKGGVPGGAGVIPGLLPGAVPVSAAQFVAATSGGSVSGSSDAAMLRERERAAAEAAPSTYGGVAGTAGAVINTAVARPPRRRTPLQFNRPHLVASYAMSLLLKVKPKYAGRGRLRNDVEVAPPRIRDGTSSLLRMYPGPLQGRKLHKDKIISFCKEQIRLGPTKGCTALYATQKKPQGSVTKYRASHALMWHLLILLLRQNGYIADTDVGDLLLENQQEYPYDPSEFEPENEPNAEAEQDAAAPADKAGESDLDSESAAGVTPAEPLAAGAATSSSNGADGVNADGAAQAGQTPLSEQAATDKFRSYVLRGNVEEALQWATDNGLWTHAFFLALYEDRYALTDVAQKFLNRAIKANDPLQTLYQMKSCHTPACVSQLRDEQWGDWRSHLSILVTNKSRQPEYDRSSVVALGDTLFQRGDIYAAHFCYLVAQEEFGRYDSSATELTTLTANVPRLILLGSSHYKHFNEFASNEAIIMTEIYEYARSLFDPKFSIAQFQHYKFLLATRILDYGQHFRCTNYLEQIARHIELKPESYDSDFIQRVCGLAERLRYHDPILINRVSFASPPNASSKDSAAPEEKAWLRQLRSLANVPQQEQLQQLQQNQQIQQEQNDIDQQFAEVNKQFRELNMQYESNSNIENAMQPQLQPLDQQPSQQPAQQQVLSESHQQPPQQYYEPPAHAPTESDAYGQGQPPYYDPNAGQHQYDPNASQLHYDPNAAHHQYEQQPPQQATPSYGQIEPGTEAYQPGHATADPAAAPAGYGYDYWSGTQQPPYGDEPNENQAALKDKGEEEEEEQDEQQILQYAKQQILQQAKQQQQRQEQHTRSNGAASTNNRFKSHALKQERSSGSLRKRQEASRTGTIAAAAAAIAQITPATVAAAAAASPATSAKAFNLNDVSSFSNTNKRHQATSSNNNSSNNRSSSNQTAAAATATKAATATVPAVPNQLLSCRKSNSQNSPYLATPKTLTTPTRFIAAKAATVTATPTAPATSTTTSIGARGSSTKRVYFNLPSTIAESDQELEHELDYEEELEEENTMALAQAKPNVHLTRKPHIVFNGTYPIDMPLTQGQSQLKNNSYDPEANTDRGDLQRYRNYMLHDYVIDEDAEGEELAEEEGEEDEYGDEDLFPYADDDESFDDGDYYTHQLLNKYGIIPSGENRGDERTPASVEAATSAAQPQHVWSMKELIANPAIPLNYKKMCSEVEQSLSRFENYLDSKKEQQLQPGAAVRTFDIDAPTRRGHRSSTSADAGSALRSKKKL